MCIISIDATQIHRNTYGGLSVYLMTAVSYIEVCTTLHQIKYNLKWMHIPVVNTPTRHQPIVR